MSDTPIRAVLVCHGTLAEGLMDAVRHITGCPTDAVVPLTNRGKSPEGLAGEVWQAGTPLAMTGPRSSPDPLADRGGHQAVAAGLCAPLVTCPTVSPPTRMA